MKTENVLKGLLTLLTIAVVFSFSSCTQDDDKVVAVDPTVAEIGQTVNVTSDKIKLEVPPPVHVINGVIDYKGFWAGQTLLIGGVAVSNDNFYLYVNYYVWNNWVISQTHLYAGTLANVPANKSGNPTPGHFPYATTHNPTVVVYEYAIPLTSLGSLGVKGSKIIIASHADVLKLNNQNVVIQRETAWSGCTRFVEKGNWALYADYQIQ